MTGESSMQHAQGVIPAKEDKCLVLIVDDNPTNIDILVNALRGEYRLGISKDGLKALDYVNKYHPDLILLDIMMPDMNGYEVCRTLKEDLRTKDIAIIFITAIHETASKTKGFEMGAADYITKPFNTAEVKARVRTHLTFRKMQEKLNNQNIILKQKVREKTAQIQETLRSTIQTMSHLAESRDPYTAGHQQRVSQLACAIGRKLSLPDDTIDTLRVAGLLHDIGKFRIPVDILNRPGRLLEVEYAMLKIHPQVGFELLSNIPFSGPVALIVYQHHEKLDGSGYPLGIKADQILSESRILAVADVIEAMSSHRPYRPALGTELALEEIMKNRGTQFDTDVVDACRVLLEEEDFQSILKNQIKWF
jgi:putative two-component system response regulator